MPHCQILSPSIPRLVKGKTYYKYFFLCPYLQYVENFRGGYENITYLNKNFTLIFVFQTFISV